MNIRLSTASIASHDVDALILIHVQDSEPLAEALASVDEAMQGALKALITEKDFEGKTGQTAVVYPRGAIKAARVILVGGGKAGELSVESVRRAAASAIKRAKELKAKRVGLAVLNHERIDVRAFIRATAEAALLADYYYHGQKSSDAPQDDIDTLEILVSDESEAAQGGLREGVAFGSGTILSRDLVNLPPNICTPPYLANAARDMAHKHGLTVEILERGQMETLRMGALLAVAQGSDAPPRFIILEHNAAHASELETVVLVGKGVTFDTGGYSIKPADGMVGMKSDMAGAAAVIGAMQTVAMLDLPLHVVGLVPASDNMISSKAYRPEEVITASNGKTIEVISTDAEGRLLLADALVFAKRYEPAAVVDIATLTGACVIALGHVAAGMFVTDDRLRDTLMSAAESTNEKVWPMPLYPEYKKYIESNTADMKNTGGRDNGVATAAVFLQQFVDYPAWAHIDMAGMMSSPPESPYVPAKGATGYGARLLAEFARQWAENKR